MKVKVSINEVVSAVAAHLGVAAAIVTPDSSKPLGPVEVELDCDDIAKVVRFLRRGQAKA